MESARLQVPCWSTTWAVFPSRPADSQELKSRFRRDLCLSLSFCTGANTTCHNLLHTPRCRSSPQYYSVQCTAGKQTDNTNSHATEYDNLGFQPMTVLSPHPPTNPAQSSFLAYYNIHTLYFHEWWVSVSWMLTVLCSTALLCMVGARVDPVCWLYPVGVSPGHVLQSRSFLIFSQESFFSFPLSFPLSLSLFHPSH